MQLKGRTNDTLEGTKRRVETLDGKVSVDAMIYICVQRTLE